MAQLCTPLYLIRHDDHLVDVIITPGIWVQSESAVFWVFSFGWHSITTFPHPEALLNTVEVVVSHSLELWCVVLFICKFYISFTGLLALSEIARHCNCLLHLSAVKFTPISLSAWEGGGGRGVSPCCYVYICQYSGLYNTIITPSANIETNNVSFT